jgi:cell wall assembly regulator SMI1
MTDTWGRIRAWFERYAPAVHDTLRGPASAEDLARARAAMGQELPEDLSSWWRRVDGVTSDSIRAGAVLPPWYHPYPVESALESRRLWLETWYDERQAVEADYLADLLSQPAGRPCQDAWLPMWLPIANNGGGSDLFVDLRSGPERGCVMAFDRVDGAEDQPLWPDVGAMLDEVADALAHRSAITPFTGSPLRVELLEGGRLEWVDADSG